ncbi:MAG: hypothetical protein Q9204_007591 [Flavoplaca sp. TL-2023a]
MGVSPATVLNNHRVTAASAYLQNPNDNVHILPNTTVSKVIFQGTTAKGVQLINGDHLTQTQTQSTPPKKPSSAPAQSMPPNSFSYPVSAPQTN